MPRKIGMVGGGQLGMMLGEEADLLGHEVFFLDPGEHPSAVKYGKHAVRAPLHDADAIARLLDSGIDVATIEIEHVNVRGLERLAAKVPVYPAPEMLEIIQDKFLQYEFLIKNTSPVPESVSIEDRNTLADLLGTWGEAILKKRIGSYDGGGNLRVNASTSLESIQAFFKGSSYMAQRIVLFEKEISVVCSRDIRGSCMTYDVGINHHNAAHILDYTLVDGSLPTKVCDEAKEIAMNIANAFNIVGTCAVEMFYMAGGKIVVNEVAPRVHNSGHWTMNGLAPASQFRNHILAITGQTLGEGYRTQEGVVMLNLLGVPKNPGAIFDFIPPQERDGLNIYIHNYEKTNGFNQATGGGRKIGHMIVAGQHSNLLETALKIRKETLYRPR